MLYDVSRISSQFSGSSYIDPGEYPIKSEDNLKGMKIRQLSLLSGKSNS